MEHAWANEAVAAALRAGGYLFALISPLALQMQGGSGKIMGTSLSGTAAGEISPVLYFTLRPSKCQLF